MADPVHPHLLQSGQVALVVVDVQDAFRPAIADLDSIAQRIATMVQAANLLKIPVLVTEQYPQRLGRTVKEILDVLPPDLRIVDKTAFSCCGASAFMDQLAATKARQVLVCGIEAHVCVNQTVHDLLARDYQPHLLLDCISSRTRENRQIGIDKMRASGAIPSSVELALFELMRDAKHEQFKAVQKLIK
jgi:nicotinamidase-related amidase